MIFTLAKKVIIILTQIATVLIVISLYNLLYETDYPEVILSIERDEIGISAGLQDRVIQTYGGLVHMDFTRQLVRLLPMTLLLLLLLLLTMI